MDSRTAGRMDTAERTNNIIQQVKQKKSSRTNNIKTSIRK